ncbi:MAG: hypothetical protein HFG70_07675 [Hungatella sp.]|jgi:hypothetical protein|nr:hypothetical protein [Hungatella sp.]
MIRAEMDRKALEAYDMLRGYCGITACNDCIFQGNEENIYSCILETCSQRSPAEWGKLEIE